MDVSTRLIEPAPVVTADTLIPAFRRALNARNASARTVQNYCHGVAMFAAFLEDRGMPTEPTHIAREHVETFIEHVLSHSAPATAAARYRDVRQFFRWLAEEGEVAESPMRNMRPPSVPEVPVPVVADVDLKRLLATCGAK